MRLSLLTVAFSLLITWCQPQAGRTKSTIDTKGEQSVEANLPEQFIENAALVASLESDLALIVKNPRFTIEKELVDNRHVDNLIDTVKHFKYDRIAIQSYKAVSEEWIFEADIQNPDLRFSNSIKIGMDKKELAAVLKTPITSNIVKVGNTEQTSVFVFTFKDNLLRELKFDGYVD